MIIEDHGIIISTKEFEERYLIVQCFLRNNGLLNGLVRISKASKTDCLLGNIVEATWSARLREQLGHYKFELITNIFAATIFDRRSIYFIRAAFAMSMLVLHEKDKQIELFDNLKLFLLSAIGSNLELFYSTYLSLEFSILRAGGFGLSLEKCVVSGEKEDLFYISPKSGAAVSKKVGAPYHDKLLLLPEKLLNFKNGFSKQELVTCLGITSFFIEKNILSAIGKKMPYERELMLETLR